LRDVGRAFREESSDSLVGQLTRVMRSAARRGDTETLDEAAAQIHELYERERRSALIAEQRSRSDLVQAHNDRAAAADLAAAEALRE
jgi:hypothetical protein